MYKWLCACVCVCACVFVCVWERESMDVHTRNTRESERACRALRSGVRGQLLLTPNINIITLWERECLCVSVCVSSSAVVYFRGRPGFCSPVKDSKALTVCCCTNNTLATVSKCFHWARDSVFSGSSELLEDKISRPWKLLPPGSTWVCVDVWNSKKQGWEFLRILVFHYVIIPLKK